MRMIPIAIVMAVSTAHAEPAQTTIAMLPFDTDAKLEIYSQPVAAEVAKTLTSGGFDVVVVSGKMVVPERARLVVDGTIKMGKGDAVTLVARVRDPHEAATIETLVINATLTSMDHAAEELSSKVLPAVKARVVALEHKAEPVVDKRPPPGPPQLPPVLVALAVDPSLGTSAEPLRAALAVAIAPWATRHHHDAKLVNAKDLPPRGSANNITMSVEIRAFTIDEAHGIPVARAKVRVLVRVLEPYSWRAVFDRVIVTDSVVGDKNIAPNALAARVASEVLMIADPHLKREITAWR